jgi:hypothetical protein
MKTAEDRLIDFLRANPSKYASAELQRMTWANKNGTTATPRSIVRRLEENAGPDGILEVSYDEHGNAWYEVKQEHVKKEIMEYVRHPLTGERITTQEYALL